MDGRTNEWTDIWTNTASLRDAKSLLKSFEKLAGAHLGDFLLNMRNCAVQYDLYCVVPLKRLVQVVIKSDSTSFCTVFPHTSFFSSKFNFNSRDFCVEEIFLVLVRINSFSNDLCIYDVSNVNN